MTAQPTRDQLRADVELGKDLTGTIDAGWEEGYYPAMKRIFEAVPRLLDQLDQAEAELDSWMARAYEAEKRAWQAEARIKAVQDVLDAEEACPRAIGGGHDRRTTVRIADIRRALESVPPPSA